MLQKLTLYRKTHKTAFLQAVMHLDLDIWGQEGGWSEFKNVQASDSKTCLRETGLLMLAASQHAISVPFAFSHAHTLTSAEASDVTSIRFSARNMKTAAARTRKEMRRTANQMLVYK